MAPHETAAAELDDGALERRDGSSLPVVGMASVPNDEREAVLGSKVVAQAALIRLRTSTILATTPAESTVCERNARPSEPSRSRPREYVLTSPASAGLTMNSKYPLAPCSIACAGGRASWRVGRPPRSPPYGSRGVHRVVTTAKAATRGMPWRQEIARVVSPAHRAAVRRCFGETQRRGPSYASRRSTLSLLAYVRAAPVSRRHQVGERVVDRVRACAGKERQTSPDRPW